jgi:hypothetical protein
MALDFSQLTPDQIASLGWLGTAQWGGSSASLPNNSTPYSMAALQDPLGPQASNEADQKWANTIARRMRQQTPTVPPPDGPEPDTSAFATGASPIFGSLAPASPLSSSTGPVFAGPPAPPMAAPPLPPARTIGNAPNPINLPMTDGSTLPPNSTPTIGTAPPQMAGPPALTPSQGAPPQQQPADPSLLDKLGAGLANFGYGARAGGLFGAISGAIEGDTTGRRIDPIGQENQTINYLQRKGYAADEARAITSNPAVLQQILPATLGMSPKEHVTIKTAFGDEIPLTFDQKSGRYFTADGQPFGAGSVNPASAAAAQPVNIDPKTGRDEQFLASLNPLDRAGVNGVLNGDMNAQSRNLQKYLPAAQRAEPGFQQQTYFTRLATMKDFAPQGTSGKNITAINTALGHIQQMYDTADQLGNLQHMPMLNTPYNAARSQLDPDFQKNVAAFRATAIGSSGELAKAFRSAGMSEKDINDWKNLFDEDSSPTTIKAAADQALHMLDTRLDAVADSYNRGMGLASNKGGPDLLSPTARAIHDRILGGGGAAPGAAPQPQQQASPQIPRPTSAAERSALPRGTIYMAPDGSQRIAQ